jgi:hypothetical protein
MRPFLALFTAPDLTSAIVGFFLLWNHGFDYEQIFPLGSILLTMFAGALIGALSGDLWQINYIR